MTGHAGAILGMVFLAHAAAAQFIQQGNKLVGAGAVGPAGQGMSVAISADGNTAIVGGAADSNLTGATWVYTRSEGVWSQQGSKLVGTGTVGMAEEGISAAISADGNTAIVGGRMDSRGIPGLPDGQGAAWVFTRSGSVWTQQGSKLVGTGAVWLADQGTSVAISGDGNTAIVGGPGDNNFNGAAWVYTRSGGVWSQQGGKLIGSDAVGAASQGTSVAISADGNTAIVGGPSDDGFVGAAWVYTRSGGVWSQQGNKLVGSGAVGTAWRGFSVAISGDGNTAIVGGPDDTPGSEPGYATGAAWVFTRTGEAWSQQGSKLVGEGANGTARQGYSVAISADGNTAVVGGPGANYSWLGPGDGATWVFNRRGAAWSRLGSKLVGTDAVGAVLAAQGRSVAISADGKTAIVGGPHDDSETGAAWVFSASSYVAWVPVASHTSGRNNSQWRSDLGLLNPGALTANVQINFFGSTGVVSNTTYVSPQVQSILTDVVGQLDASGSGALEVISDQPLKVTARSYNQVAADANCSAAGTLGQDYPAVVSSNGLGAGESAYLAGLTENASYRCNIGLVNTGTASATVLVELFDGSGAKLTDYTMPLPPGEWAQVTQPFLNYAQQTAMDRGHAKITVQTGSGVFGFASLVDNVTSDPTTVVMQR